MTDWIERARKIDPRVLWVILIIVMAFPLISPLGLPFESDPRDYPVYDYMENTLPEGSTVMFNVDILPFAWDTQFMCATMWCNHMFRRNMKIIFISFDYSTLPMETKLMPLLKDLDMNGGTKVYGVDWIRLGVVMGFEAGAAAWAADVHKTTPNDYVLNQPLSTFPITQNIKTAADLDLVMRVSTKGLIMMSDYITLPYNVPFIYAGSFDHKPAAEDALLVGKLVGYLAGIPSFAAYEKFSGELGDATRQMDTQSTTMILGLIFVAVSNVLYFIQRSQKGPELKKG
jgi:hypothetical protein